MPSPLRFYHNCYPSSRLFTPRQPYAGFQHDMPPVTSVEKGLAHPLCRALQPYHGVRLFSPYQAKTSTRHVWVWPPGGPLAFWRVYGLPEESSLVLSFSTELNIERSVLPYISNRRLCWLIVSSPPRVLSRALYSSTVSHIHHLKTWPGDGLG